MMARFPATSSDVLDLDLPCDFSQPARAESALREILDTYRGQPERGSRALEIRTQIARLQAMQGAFERALDTLAAMAKLVALYPGSALSLRHSLESARVATLLRTPSRARPMFLNVWSDAQRSGLEFYAIDAAQMLAIIEPPKVRLEWLDRALALAVASKVPRVARWRGAIHQLIGWHHFQSEQLDKALLAFGSAVSCSLSSGDHQLSIDAHFGAGRTLRAQRKYVEALSTQEQLIAPLQRSNTASPWVHEELGECLLALNRKREAQRHFAIAFEFLGSDAWLTDNEPSRVLRLKKLAREIVQQD